MERELKIKVTQMYSPINDQQSCIDVLLFRETDRPRHGDNETYANPLWYNSYSVKLMD